MKTAKILIAKYRKGLMTKEQILNYIDTAMSAKYDSEAIEYIKSSL